MRWTGLGKPLRIRCRAAQILIRWVALGAHASDPLFPRNQTASLHATINFPGNKSVVPIAKRLANLKAKSRQRNIGVAGDREFHAMGTVAKLATSYQERI